MTYQETLQFLFSRLPMFHRIGAAAYKDNLDNTMAISELLGKPELRFPAVHIAGTNGKGSVSHFIASVLQEAGFKTGLFTSPHLRDFRERIRINGKMIPQREVTRFVESCQTLFDSLQPSFFEWTFGLATDYFARQKVDVAVIETGMGGRLDSTNIIHPEITVITNIGYDHMQFLGDTLTRIASEKAGIFKAGIPIVIGETQPETDHVFIQKATKLKSVIIFADQHYQVDQWTITKHQHPRLILRVKKKEEQLIEKYTSPLTGQYQIKNILTVLQTIEGMKQKGFMIQDEDIRKGIRRVIRNTRFKGRWQVISQNPLIIADIGHNKDGIAEIVSQIGKTSHDRLHLVLGVVNDKDINSILKLLPGQATYYFCKADIPRGLDASILKKKASQVGLHGASYISVKEALDAARKAAGNNDLVVICGSAFVVAEII
jgi:dihydrofolate synthase / folylpolyglutamate synthase